MNLEHHVTSLELSKRLKELGVPQWSCFYWSESKSKQAATVLTALEASEPKWWKHRENISAFLASELGNMLPVGQSLKLLTKECWQASFGTTGTAGTEADARAFLLMHLIEQQVVDPKTL